MEKPLEILHGKTGKMALILKEHKSDFSPFHKCGEIMAYMFKGEANFVLNCLFCTSICLGMEMFHRHVNEKHRNEILSSDQDDAHEKWKCRPSVEEKEDDVCIHETKPSHIDDDQEEENNDGMDDPLEGEPMSMCVTPMRDDDDDGDELKSDDQRVEGFVEESKDEGSASEWGSEIECDNADDIEEDSRDLLLAIIKDYERNPVLWDRINCPSSKREEALRTMSDSIRQTFGINLTQKSIANRLKKLRYKFRREWQNQKLAETRGDATFTPSWYYNNLMFLHKTIKYKPRNKRGTKAEKSTSLPLPNLTDSQNMEFIEIYKSFPCLWDMQHIGFRFKAQRNEALNEMIALLKNKMQLHYNQDELQKKLYRIRYACTQEKHRRMQCERAQEEFEPSPYFANIAFLECHVGPFKCEFCEETFNGGDQYRIHRSKHDGTMPFVCPICKRGFMKVGNCTVHVRRHTRDFPFECKVCSKRYATTTDVNVHMRYHTGEKPYFCEVCGQSFRTWSFFDAHMRRHQKRPNHKCTICARAFYENNKLTEHMKAHLNVRDKVCNICGKAFTSAKYLRQHKQIHAEKKKYVCRICCKPFAQYAGLSGHMKSHGTTVGGGGGVVVLEDSISHQ